ncbi:hypothetical protein E3O67_00910 [Cryobacterium sp. TMT3-29-2]|nr:hypothetical protein E3O67_00910 [Cryobacterium sp. TMT3-29-2]
MGGGTPRPGVGPLRRRFAGGLDAVTFTSAPTVAALFGAFRDTVVAAAVGPVTAAPLVAPGIRPLTPEGYRWVIASTSEASQVRQVRPAQPESARPESARTAPPERHRPTPHGRAPPDACDARASSGVAPPRRGQR